MPFCSFPKRRGDMLVAVASAPRASPLPTRPHKTWSFLGLPGCDTPPPEDLLRQFFHNEPRPANPRGDGCRPGEEEESDSSSLHDDSEEDDERPRRISIEAQLFPAPLPIPTLTLKSNRTPPPSQPPPAAAAATTTTTSLAHESNRQLRRGSGGGGSGGNNDHHHPHLPQPTMPIPPSLVGQLLQGTQPHPRQWQWQWQQPCHARHC
ncbi:hypothetical protein SLS58_007059 [Diplodia intermedia]|uniref:Uncharacterized protein n=1 Tax=Diplodia intermedia TaxID=856260 RepID=A0ABR3TLD3_9PEZI